MIRYQMRVLVSFDVDGTLEISDGPIPISTLEKLKRVGWIVGIAGNYSKFQQLCPQFQLDFYGTKEILSKLKSQFNPDLAIHVGDTEDDRARARAAGFCFIHANDFMLNDPVQLSSLISPNLTPIIIAGGFATRLAPASYAIPKSLFPIGNRPILDQLIQQLRVAGFDHAYIATMNEYRSQFLRWAAHQPIRISFRFERTKHTYQLGGSVNAFYQIACRLRQRNWLVMFGNMLLSDDYWIKKLVEGWNPDQIVAGVAYSDHPSKYGVVEIDADGYIAKFEEKPKSPSSALVCMGAYIFPEWSLRYVSKFLRSHTEFHRFGELIGWLLEQGAKIKAHRVEGKWFYLDDPQSYLDLWRWYLSTL